MSVIRVAVALRLGLNVRAPHTCRCGMLVDAHGQRGLVCKQAPSRIARHQQLNDMVIGCASSGVGGRHGDQRSSRHFTTKWQTPGRNDANTMALGQAADLGRHSCEHSGTVLRRCRSSWMRRGH